MIDFCKKTGFFERVKSAFPTGMLSSKAYHPILLFSSFFVFSGCASYPENLNGMDDLRRLMIEEEKRIDLKYPQWKNLVSDDVIIIDYYDKNGKKVGSAVAR